MSVIDTLTDDQVRALCLWADGWLGYAGLWYTNCGEPAPPEHAAMRELIERINGHFEENADETQPVQGP